MWKNEIKTANVIRQVGGLSQYGLRSWLGNVKYVPLTPSKESFADELEWPLPYRLIDSLNLLTTCNTRVASLVLLPSLNPSR